MAYTTIDDPSAHFQGTEYTGTGSDRSVTNAGDSDLQPDLVWIKTDTASSHMWQDSTRGVTKYLRSNLSSAEGTASSVIQAFQTDGFSLPAGGGNNVNGEVSMSWQWKCGAGSTSTNSDGGTNSTVQANQTAGFTIAKWLGAGSLTTTTIGHGLGSVPHMIITKRLGGTADWCVYHRGLTSGNFVGLNLDSAQTTGDYPYGSTAPTSSVFHTSSQFQATDNYISYCFTSIQGYSKFGSYKGNGNADGVFVYTGFKPAMIILKNYANAGYNWWILDSERSTMNPVTDYYFPNLNVAEEHLTSLPMDLVSNGFKFRTNNTGINGNGHSYIFAAFAENPFVSSSGVPCTAR